MGNVKIVLDSAGIRALLKSKEIAAACEVQAEKLTLATGMPYVPDVYVGKTRVNASGLTKDSRFVDKKQKSGKKGKTRGNWVTIDGKRRFVKGYARTNKDGKKTYTQLYKKK